MIKISVNYARFGRILRLTRNKIRDLYGGIAQLVEHLPCKQGVTGSNPITSTRYIIRDSEFRIPNSELIKWAHSSAG